VKSIGDEDFDGGPHALLLDVEAIRLAGGSGFNTSRLEWTTPAASPVGKPFLTAASIRPLGKPAALKQERLHVFTRARRALAKRHLSRRQADD
jgi:hypothetical protein